MKNIYKDGLLKAVPKIYKNGNYGICYASPVHLNECPEFMAFCPYDKKITSIFWWRDFEIETRQNERLIAIAFMITMPEDMVPEL